MIFLMKPWIGEEEDYEEISQDFIKEVEKLNDEDIDGDNKIG